MTQTAKGADLEKNKNSRKYYKVISISGLNVLNVIEEKQLMEKF